MIIHYLCITDTCFGPPEADPVLLVDADAVLPFPIPFQSFQVITGRDSQVRQSLSVVEEGGTLPSWSPLMQRWVFKIVGVTAPRKSAVVTALTGPVVFPLESARYASQAAS